VITPRSAPRQGGRDPGETQGRRAVEKRPRRFSSCHETGKMESPSNMARKPPTDQPSRLDEIESGVSELFSGMASMLGLPPSIGAIYGLLFISEEPLCLDDLVTRLGISKGSASQGLSVLRRLGALRAASPAGRREYYAADLQLKKLVGGFLRSEVIPQLDRGAGAIADLRKSSLEIPEAHRQAFLQERLAKLENWQHRGRQVLGLLHRFLD
jgi:DNA-binding transcriptional regulator GbsR (MarR family)